MRARPELILLQKSMVLVEGVARALDPELDIWTVSEPVVGDWVRREAGPLGRLEELKVHFDTAVASIGRLPAILEKAEAALDDYERDKHAPGRRFTRFMLVSGFWLAAILIVVMIWRLLTV